MISNNMINAVRGIVPCTLEEARAVAQAVLDMPEVRELVLAGMADWELEQASVARRVENE